MKNIKLSKLFFIVAVTVSLTACNKSSKYGNTSRGTGWKINDKEGGFQYNTKFKEQETAPGLVFVEGGTFTMGKGVYVLEPMLVDRSQKQGTLAYQFRANPCHWNISNP